MFSNLKKISLITTITSALLACPLAFSAESLNAYAAKCKTELEIDTIPGYSCSQGVSIPGSSNFSLPSLNNWLGKVDTGNPNVDAIFLCRNAPGQTSGLNGYILQNRISGKTCFFDAKGGNSTNVPAIDGSPNANAAWRQPIELTDTCVNCHSADPFIVTPGIAQGFSQLKLIYNGRRLKDGPYTSVNSSDPNSRFAGWDALANPSQEGNCAAACHRKNGPLATSQDTLLLNLGAMPASSSSAFSAAYTLSSAIPVSLKNKYKIRNIWHSDWHLNNEFGSILAAPVEPFWWSANWTFVQNSDGYYYIRNEWKQNEFLHIENGPLEVGNIKSYWWGAQWILVPVTNVPSEQLGKVFRIQNRWKRDIFINVEVGSVQATPAPDYWDSAKWLFEKQ